MAYIPNFVKNSDLSSATLNAIGADIGVGVTVVQNDLSTLHNYEKVVMGTSVMQNSFLSALMNRVVRAEYTSRAYRNPYSGFKKGVLDFGEAIEEIYVEIAKGVKRNEDKLNPKNPLTTVAIPDVKSKFYLSNVRCHYDLTVYQVDLRKAFLNFGAIDDLIARLVEKVYTEHNYDEELLTKFTLSLRVLDAIKGGRDVNLLLSASASEETYGKALLRNARKLAGIIPHMKTSYNEAGVHTFTPVDNIVCFINANAQAIVDVDALAGAFNMSKADFIGKIVGFDTFTLTDDEKARIIAITDLTSATWPISDEDNTLLEGVGCVIADNDLLRIYDTVEPIFTEQFNAIENSWNYFLHVDQVFGASPFLNIIPIDNETQVDITATLTACTSNNSATKVTNGIPYNAVITANDGYSFDDDTAVFTVEMDDVDITDDVVTYNTDKTVATIAIDTVDGDIEITATAIAEEA